MSGGGGGNERVRGMGLHTSTFRLNLSAFGGIGGTFRGCVGVCRVCQGVLGGV